MRIAMLVVSLEMGGAQRVTVTLANHWVTKGTDVCVVSYDGPEIGPAYELDPRVRYEPLGLARVSRTMVAGVRNNLLRLRAVRHVLKDYRPHAVIGHQDREGVVAIVAARGLGIPVIAHEHTHSSPDDIGAAWSRIRGWSFPFADAIVVPTERAADFFKKRAHAKTVVLPNPIRPIDDEMRAPPELRLTRPSIVALGNLRAVKNYPLLLRAFGRVARMFPSWSLTVLGEGPDRERLESLRRELGLEGRVHFPGAVANPAAILAQADLYALTSDREGFTNALCEALACGVPAIATDCPSGPGEIIRHGVDGLLVPVGDVGAVAEALRSLMGDEAARRKMGAQARSIVARCGVDVIAARYEELIRRVRMARGLPEVT